MQTIAMTADEKEDFKELEKRVDTMEMQLFEIKSKINSILSIVKGIAIGIAIGGLIFGYLSIKDFITVAK